MFASDRCSAKKYPDRQPAVDGGINCPPVAHFPKGANGLIRIKEAIIVEGKYDKVKLSSLIDGLILETRVDLEFLKISVRWS